MAVSQKGEMFNQVKVLPPTHNIFSLQHMVLTTLPFGYTKPIACIPVNPNETYKCKLEAFWRSMPLNAPMMSEVNLRAYSFFVPTRLMYRKKHWEEFITGGKDGKKEQLPKCTSPGDVASFVRQQVEYEIGSPDSSKKDDWKPFFEKYLGSKSLWAHLGYAPLNLDDIPEYKVDNDPDNRATTFTEWLYNLESNPNITGIENYVTYEPFYGYHLIWSEYYRDHNIVEEPVFLEDLHDRTGFIDGREWFDRYGDVFFDFRKVALEKDYFTSALPEPQRGIDVPIPSHVDQFTFTGSGYISFTKMGSDSSGLPLAIPAGPQYAKRQIIPTGMIGENQAGETVVPPNGTDHPYLVLAAKDVASSLSARVNVVAGTINELREAIRTQEFFELSARVGNRLKEMILAHFGEFVPDYRIDRPEYLGGCKIPLIVSQVLQSSETDNTALGDMAGNGIGAGSEFLFDYHSYEHGWLYIMVHITPRTSYFQGMPRWMKRMSRFDYYWDKFANLGEQAVEKGELYFDWLDNNSDEENSNNFTFGYQSRYSEYKFMNNRVLGDFQGNLDYWHMARKFNRDTAKLNENFLYGEYDQYNRIFAYNEKDFDQFLVEFNIDLTASRPMPIYGTPKL